MKVNKRELIKYLIEELEKDLVFLRESAKATLEAATHEESRPENEYDTRGLEASYLARAQTGRVNDVEDLIKLYKFVQLKDFSEDDPISSSALVGVELNGKKSFVFLLPKGSAQIVNFKGQAIQVITPTSPLGRALVGARAGQDVFVEVGGQTREYEILSVS